MEEKKNFSNLEKRLSLGTINFDELSLKFNSDEKTKSTFLSQRSSIIDTSFNSAVMNNISDEKNKFSLQKGSSLGLIKFDNPQNQMQFLINLTPVREIFNKILNISIEEYIFHTKVFLEYDEDQAFIFITKQTLFFTYIFLDEKDNLKSYKEITDKIILFRIDYKKVENYLK